MSHFTSSVRFPLCFSAKLTIFASLVSLIAICMTIFSRDIENTHPVTLNGSLAPLYEQWKAAHEQNGGDSNIPIALSWSKALSDRFSPGSGLINVDLHESRIVGHFSGLPANGVWDIWIIENADDLNNSVLPESTDHLLKAASFASDAQGEAVVEVTQLEALRAIRIDMIVLSEGGRSPLESRLLVGMSSLFQRYYTRERLVAVNREGAGISLIAKAYAAPPTPSLDALVLEGAELFFNETFNGNGRTCGTCHRAENNFTLDPDFIATLPDDDPLFVFETMPGLGENFEKPALLRQAGLILVNADGFDDLENKFVMRSVSHLLGLSRQIDLIPNVNDGTTVPPIQRLGWSGDGSTGSGTLREFAIGAVKQHFPLSTNRVAGVDFRLPTDHELDALEAFQLFIGRQEDPEILLTIYRDPVVKIGQEIFFGLDLDSSGDLSGEGKCHLCHRNFGSGTHPSSFNADTNVHYLPDQLANLIDPDSNPPDGGFGLEPMVGVPGAFGNGTFNAPALIEAADTGPFFHNNAVTTIEEAVKFYSSPTFAESPGSAAVRGISLSEDDSNAVAAFLRVINVQENLRSMRQYIQFSKEHSNDSRSIELIELAMCDLDDAEQVLSGGPINLHPQAQYQLSVVEQTLVMAMAQPPEIRTSYLDWALLWLDLVEDDIVEGIIPQ